MEQQQQQQSSPTPAPALRLEMTFVNETAGSLGEYPEEVVLVRAMTSKAVRGDGYRTDAVLLDRGGVVQSSDFTIEPPVSRAFVERATTGSGDTGVPTETFLQETLGEAVIFYLFATSEKALQQFDGEGAEQTTLPRDRVQVRCWPLGMAEMTIADLAGYLWRPVAAHDQQPVELRVLDTAEGWRGNGKTFEKGRLLLRAGSYIGPQRAAVNRALTAVGELVRQRGLLGNTQTDLEKLTAQGTQMITRYIHRVSDDFYPSVERIRYYHAPRCSITPVTELPASAYLLMRPSVSDVKEEALLVILDWSLLATGVPKARFVEMMRRVLDRRVKHATLELFVVSRIMADMCTVLARSVVYTPDHINKRRWKARKKNMQRGGKGGGGGGDDGGQEVLERYLMALDTLAGDCEDVGQLSYMVAAILQCGEFAWRTEVMQLLQQFSQLYVPALHVGEASNPASESRNKSLYGAVKGTVKDTICHVYATITPRCIEAVAVLRGLVLTESELEHIKRRAADYAAAGADQRMRSPTKWGYTVAELTATLEFLRSGTSPPSRTSQIYLYDWELFDNDETALGPEMFIMQLEGTSATLPFAAPAQVLLHPFQKASDFIRAQSEYEDRVRTEMERRHSTLRDLAISVMDSSYLVADPWKVNREIVSSFYLRPVAHMLALPLDSWSDVRLLLHNMIAYKTRTSEGVRHGRLQQVYGPRWGDYMYGFHTRTTLRRSGGEPGWWYANVVRFEGDELALIKRVLDRYGHPVRFPTPQEARVATHDDSTGSASVYASLRQVAVRFSPPSALQAEGAYLPTHDMYVDVEGWRNAPYLRSVYTVNAHELTPRQVTALETELARKDSPYRFMRVHVSQFTPAMKTITISLFYPNPLASAKKNPKLLTPPHQFQASSTSHLGRRFQHQHYQRIIMEEEPVPPTVELPPPPTEAATPTTVPSSEDVPSSEEEEVEGQSDVVSKANEPTWTTSYDVIQHYVSLSVSTYESMASETSNKSPELVEYLQANVPRVRDAAEKFLASVERAGFKRVLMVDRRTAEQVARWDTVLFKRGGGAKLFPLERAADATDAVRALDDQYARFAQVVNDALSIEFDIIYVNRAIGRRGANMIFRGYYKDAEWEHMRTDLVHAESSLAMLYGVPGFHHPLVFDVVGNRYRLDPHAGDHHMYDPYTARHVHQHRVSTTSAGTGRLTEHVVRANRAFAEHFKREKVSLSTAPRGLRGIDSTAQKDAELGAVRVWHNTLVGVLGRFYGLERYKGSTMNYKSSAALGAQQYAGNTLPDVKVSRDQFVAALKKQVSTSANLARLSVHPAIGGKAGNAKHRANYVHDLANLHTMRVLQEHRDGRTRQPPDTEEAYVRAPIVERFFDPTNTAAFPANTATELLPLTTLSCFSAKYTNAERHYTADAIEWFANNYTPTATPGGYTPTARSPKNVPLINPRTHHYNASRMVQFAALTNGFEDYVRWKAGKLKSDASGEVPAQALLLYIAETAITVVRIAHYKTRLAHIRKSILAFAKLGSQVVPEQVYIAYNELVDKINQLVDDIETRDLQRLKDMTSVSSEETNLEKIMWMFDDYLFVALWADAENIWRVEDQTYGLLGAALHRVSGKPALERYTILLQTCVQLLALTGVRLEHVVRRMDNFKDNDIQGYLKKYMNSGILNVHFLVSDLLMRLVFNGDQASNDTFIDARSRELKSIMDDVKDALETNSNTKEYLTARAEVLKRRDKEQFEQSVPGQVLSGLAYIGGMLYVPLSYGLETGASMTGRTGRGIWDAYVEYSKKKEQEAAESGARTTTATTGDDAPRGWATVLKSAVDYMSGDEESRKERKKKKKATTKRPPIMNKDPFDVPKPKPTPTRVSKGKEPASRSTLSTSTRQSNLTEFFKKKEASIQRTIRQDEAARTKLAGEAALAKRSVNALSTRTDRLAEEAGERSVQGTVDESEVTSVNAVLDSAEKVEASANTTIQRAAKATVKSERQLKLEDDIQALVSRLRSTTITSPVEEKRVIAQADKLEQSLNQEIERSAVERKQVQQNLTATKKQVMDVERQVKGALENMGTGSDEDSD